MHGLIFSVNYSYVTDKYGVSADTVIKDLIDCGIKHGAVVVSDMLFIIKDSSLITGYAILKELAKKDYLKDKESIDKIAVFKISDFSRMEEFFVNELIEGDKE